MGEMRIAVAGKGGTGKTTIAALIVRSLLDAGKKPILAVDADPNANFGSALGMNWKKTVSDVLDEIKGLGDPAVGYSKLEMVEYGLHQCLVEGRGVDLLVMGRPEGPDCYCAANHILRHYMDRIATSYACTVLDNEAGMEHLSRKTTRNVDVLILVSDNTLVGIRAAGRIRSLAQELNISIGREVFLLNKVTGEMTSAMRREVERYGLVVEALLPYDETVAAMAMEEIPITELHKDSPILCEIERILKGSILRCS